MIRVALTMLLGDRAKYLALLLGIAFTAFLVTFASSFFCIFLTRSFALVAENPGIDVWVMDPAVQSTEQTVGVPSSSLERVRGVEGVRSAMPLAVASVDVRFPNGKFQPVQLIGLDDATLAGLPELLDGTPARALRNPDAAVCADGGTEGKLLAPVLETDRWNHGKPRLEAPSRPLKAGDEVLVNDFRMVVVGRAAALPRFPPRPLLYTTYSNALRILPRERTRLTFVLASAAPGVSAADLALRIEAATGLRARTAEELKADTVRWFLDNSEDVGDVTAMLAVALCVGLGVTGVMFFLFTQDNLRHYALLKAMGATSRRLVGMLLAQAVLCSLLGAGIGVGLCAAAGPVVAGEAMPFRMMWFAPTAGALTVLLVALVAAALNIRPVLRLQPTAVFAGR